MNILALTPLVPYPPHDGDKLRLYHFLKYLKKKGHSIDLFCLTRVKEDFRHAESLRPLCRQLNLVHLTNWDFFFSLSGGLGLGQSLNVSSYFSPLLREKLRAYWKTTQGQEVDVVLCHRLRMAPMAFESNPGKPVVLELTDCLAAYAEQLGKSEGAPLTRKLAARWDYWFLRREEEEWSQKAFRTIVISEPDAKALGEQGVEPEKITVIPNGVEPTRVSRVQLASFYPKKAPSYAKATEGRQVVCFVGNMGYAANEDGALWFLKEVWPLVKQRVSGAIFAAVGGQPGNRLRRFHNGEDVLVTGWVQEIEPYLAHSQVSVAPLRVASGMQNKVALSLALGVPVVATPAAVAWMPPKGRESVIVTAGSELFAQEVSKALLKPRLARARALKGKRFIMRNYKWNESGRKLEKILKDAVKQKV